MRLFCFSLLFFFFCPPTYADEIQQYLDLSFVYYELNGSANGDIGSKANKDRISIDTPSKFKKLLIENACAMAVASSSALIVENSQRLPIMLEALVKHQVMQEYLGGRQIDHFSITHRILQAKGHEASNSVFVEIHYKDGQTSYYPASNLKVLQKKEEVKCTFFTEIELIDLLLEALNQDLDGTIKRYGIDGEDELGYLKLHTLGQAKSWTRALDVNLENVEGDEAVCGWIKDTYDNVTLYMTCLEAQTMQRYFVSKTQPLLDSADDTSLEVYYETVLSWVDETARVYESFLERWGTLATKQ